MSTRDLTSEDAGVVVQSLVRFVVAVRLGVRRHWSEPGSPGRGSAQGC